MLAITGRIKVSAETHQIASVHVKDSRATACDDCAACNRSILIDIKTITHTTFFSVAECWRWIVIGGYPSLCLKRSRLWLGFNLGDYDRRDCYNQHWLRARSETKLSGISGLA